MQYTPQDGFPYYFDLVPEGSILSHFQSPTTFDFLKSIDNQNSSFRYAPNKWSIKQILGHITDHERIKIHRAFLLSRKEKVQLWGYDQNTLVENSRFEELSFLHLCTDFLNVRKASISFIECLSESQLRMVGNARHHEISLEEFLISIIGHETHHINIIKEKYI